MFKERIYQNYVSGRGEPLAPTTIDGLSPRKAFLVNLIRKYFPRDRESRILEIGCGHGALIHFATLEGYRNITGVDVSKEQVAAAQQLGIQNVQSGDALESLKTLSSESHDAIIAIDVLEHLDRNELFVLVDEVNRVLKKGGEFIVHVPNAGSPFFGLIRYGDITHENAFTSSSLEQVFLSSAYTTVTCHEDMPIVHGLKSALRWLIWRIIRGCLRGYLAAETGSTAKNAIFSQNLLAVAIK